MASNRKAGEPYTNHELKKSTRTKFIQSFPNGASIYSHTVRQMAGKFVVIDTYETNWDTHETFQDAKRSVVYRGR